jgi:trk system potassium uptake protein TrkA
MYIIIAGAGLIGRETTIMLTGNKHDVVVIDFDREVCDKIHADTGAMAVNGSATDIRVLIEAGAGKADVVIAVMNNDADNISCALLSKSLGVPRVIARLMDPRYEQAYKLAGVTSVVRMADLLLNQIIMEVEQPRVRKIMVLGGGKAQIYAVKIPDKARSIGMAIREITREKRFPQECVFTGVYREEEGEFIFPRGDYIIRGGDTVSLVSTTRYIKPATDFLTKV